jgi:molybdopterin-guanine dinucleotide biosynthesis protein A
MGDCCNQDKHSKLVRATWGEFGKNELGIKAKNEEMMRQVIRQITPILSKKYKIAFLDKYNIHLNGFSQALMNVQFLSQGQSAQFESNSFPNEFYRKALLGEQDLVLINANQLPANHVITITDYPDAIFIDDAIFQVNEVERLTKFITSYIESKQAKLNGLVLMGGKSSRMGKDKSRLAYHGKMQKDYVHELLSEVCEEAFFSVRADQLDSEKTSNQIEDRFNNLGPMGGILSALMSQPERAWLVVACDLPFIDRNTLQFLVSQRNTSKIATAFLDSEGVFPEPLLAIWEPKSYTSLFHFLSLGYSCPRKVLINSDIQLLKAPNPKVLTNANEPSDYEKAKEELLNIKNKTL